MSLGRGGYGQRWQGLDAKLIHAHPLRQLLAPLIGGCDHGGDRISILALGRFHAPQGQWGRSFHSFVHVHAGSRSRVSDAMHRTFDCRRFQVPDAEALCALAVVFGPACF